MKQRLFKLLFCLLLFSFLPSCRSLPEKEEPASSFSDYTKTLFASEAASNTLSLHYSLVHPEDYDIPEQEASLGRFGCSQIAESLCLAEELLDELHCFSYDTLTLNEQLTYDVLEAALTLTLSSKGLELYQEQLGPTTGVQAQLPLLLAEYRIESKEDIESYFSLLPCVYTYFSDLAAYERERAAAGLFMSDAGTKEVIAQCLAFTKNPEENYLITYFDEKLAELPSLTAAERAAYQTRNMELVFRYVLPAYDLLIDTLTELEANGNGEYGLCHYPLGKRYYEYLVQSSTGSFKTIPELEERLEAALAESLLFLQTMVSESPSIYEEYITFSYPVTEPKEALLYLKNAICDAFPAPASVSCQIKYVHASLENYVSPAMYFVPPLDGYGENSIYINKSPLYDLSRLFPTLAHEGYPGHLYQNTFFLQTNPDPIRCLLNFPGYDEGWATYAESLSYSLAGLNQPLADFLKANLVSTLCLYSLTDIRIHYNGASKEEIIAGLTAYGFSVKTAESIFETLLAEPAMYHPYAIGYLELLELKEQFRLAAGEAYTDKAFHRFLLTIGPAPFYILEKYLNPPYIDTFLNN